MEIIEIKENKRQYLPLLLLADEQENRIDRYLDRGTMYVLDLRFLFMRNAALCVPILCRIFL